MALPSNSCTGAAAGGAEWPPRKSSHLTRGTQPDAPLQTDGFCVQVRSSTLRLGAAAFLGLAARATATRCFNEWSGLLLGAAPAMSLGEDNS